MTDDGLPISGYTTAIWTKTSGPGNVTFGNANSAQTTVTFDQAGTYVLMLTGSDTVLSSSHTVTVTISGGGGDESLTEVSKGYLDFTA